MTGPASVTHVSVTHPPGGGRVSTRLSASGPVERPVVRPVLVDSDSRRAVVSLVQEGALLLSGDEVRIEIQVGAGACLELLEPAGTVAYPMAGGQARWDVRIDLGPGAALIWAGEPFVVAHGASVVRLTHVSMVGGARLALREVLVLGRHGEEPGELQQELDVAGSDGVPLLHESLHVRPGSNRLLTGGARAISTVLLLGERLPDCGDGTHLELETKGTMVRGLAAQAHRAVPAASWAAARRLALARAGGHRKHDAVCSSSVRYSQTPAATR